MPVPANTLQLIENLLDITHFYPLHDANIGDVENSRIPVEIEEGTSAGNAYVGTTRAVRGYRQPPYLEDYLGYDFVDRDHTHCMLSPAVTRVEMRVWPAGWHGDASIERGLVIVHTQFNYPDDGYFEVFLRSDTALRRAQQILTRLERAERNPKPPNPQAAGAAEVRDDLFRQVYLRHATK